MFWALSSPCAYHNCRLITARKHVSGRHSSGHSHFSESAEPVSVVGLGRTWVSCSLIPHKRPTLPSLMYFYGQDLQKKVFAFICLFPLAEKNSDKTYFPMKSKRRWNIKKKLVVWLHETKITCDRSESREGCPCSWDRGRINRRRNGRSSSLCFV